MTRYIRILIFAVIANSISVEMSGQVNFFSKGIDTCCINDFFIVGTIRFDTLTEVVPPKSYNIHYKKQKQNFRINNRRYDYATEKCNVHKLIIKNKDQYQYSLFDEDIYLVAIWPYVFYKNFIIHCVHDSLQKKINENMNNYLHTYNYYGTPYTVEKFRCIDYRQQQFLVVMMNVNFYNNVVDMYNFCPGSYILPEFDENISKGLYVKVLLPIY